MRVIAGKARRLALKTVPGMETRPTTDRIKETLFNILQPEIPDCRFLDLFSGSGGIGIEALSRGAESAVFVEKNPKACACIRENLTFTKLAEHGKLLNMDVLQALRSLEGEEAFDCIFMDPPYNKDLERQVLEYLKDSSLAKFTESPSNGLITTLGMSFVAFSNILTRSSTENNGLFAEFCKTPTTTLSKETLARRITSR